MDSNFETAKAHFLRGLESFNSKAYEVAESEFRQALALVPDRPSTLTNLQAVLIQLGKIDEAFEIAQKLLLLEPSSAETYLNLGNVQKEMALRKAAIRSFEIALSFKPDYEAALNNLGIMFLEEGRYVESKVKFEAVLKANPNSASALSHLGALYMQMGDNLKALGYLAKSVARDPSSSEAFNNLGNVYFALNNYPQAVQAYGEALKLNSHTDWLLAMRFHAQRRMCDWKDYDASVEELLHQIKNNRKVGPPFTLIGLPVALSDQTKLVEKFVEIQFPVLKPILAAHSNVPGKKIRVAYLSADYHNHATSYLMAEMIELHDRSRFELIGLCYGRSTKDEMRDRVSRSFDQFIEVAEKSDQEIAEILRDMNVDIAVDLKGHTQGSRLGILAERAAPIQIHYLGYPGTLGAKFIDYLIADPTLIPVEHQEYYTEKIIYLPDTYQVNDRSRRIAAVATSRMDHGLPERGFVYCCFNNNWKITPDIFDLWMRLLNQVEASVIWLFEDNAEAVGNLRQEAASRGVSPDRLVFAKKMPLDQHLARHRHADLFLDTLYCNAHTTASDALWAGLPLITMLGNTYSSRVGASLLRAIKVPELVVYSIKDYEALAIDLAQNPGRLAGIRQKLADNRSTAALFDTPRFTKHLESAYEAIWSRYLAGQMPDHIRI